MTVTYNYRVGRYKPGTRHTATSTWTSVSDIGRRFDDGVLTKEEYERVEYLYLEAVRAVATEVQVDELEVSDLLLGPAASVEATQIRNGDTITVNEALGILRLELREELSCRLKSDDRLHVDAGFDFYIYLGTCDPIYNVISEIEASGLFVERNIPSPYMTG